MISLLGPGSQGVAHVCLCAHPLLVQDSLGLCLYAKRSLLLPIRWLEVVGQLFCRELQEQAGREKKHSSVIFPGFAKLYYCWMGR